MAPVWLHYPLLIGLGLPGASSDAKAATAENLPAELSPGLYYDPAHNGHGFDLQRVGPRWVMVFYTFDSAGMPEWMLGVLEAEAEEDTLSGRLDAYDYQADREVPQQLTRNAGSVTLDVAADCGPDARGRRFQWSLDGNEGDWCVQALLPQQGPGTADFTGLWYGGPADQGWGLSLDFDWSPEPATEVRVLFYYGSQGQPVWALGAGSGGADILMQSFQGYCRTCAPTDLNATDAGTISHSLSVLDGWRRGAVTIDLTAAGTPGDWVRDNADLTPLSDPVPGLIPLPEHIAPDRPVAIVNTTVVALTAEDAVAPHQTLVIRDGVIAAQGDHGAVSIPDDAVGIDGSGLYVGPGLHDMHTHFSFGGVTPMREAGTLFIANGVTTVLNMGDGGTQNLPGTDSVYAEGTLIGPTVYAGAAAYGPGDGRAPRVTITSLAEATEFAEDAQRQGYTFLKLYNSLSPAVVAQFVQEGLRLGMPVNGHLPKTMSMPGSLEGGLGMIAHVAEIYFTLFSNRPDDEHLAEAAQLMLTHGTYLTDTLTASESFAANYGGNETAFLEFSRREGIRYQPTSFAENGWRNFFESNTLNPPGAQPGQLDDRLAYFKKMVRYFNDAGVKLILGTDSPGHIGVVSGFSVHENLRLYREIGLSNFDAYRAASRNPAQYLTESLGLPQPGGVVEAGARADLLLLTGNPLADLTFLKRPQGVMTRGRFFSRELLDEALLALDEKYRDPFTRKALPQFAPLPEGVMCDHDGH